MQLLRPYAIVAIIAIIARNKRDQRLTSIWESVKRARAIVKGMYGDDSSEYELIGGTRMSEHRKSIRKQAA